MKDVEIWRDIQGWTNYQVSNFGRIRSIERNEVRHKGNTQYVAHIKEYLLKPSIINSGYHVVWLCHKSTYKALTVHRLVAKAFIPNPKNLPEVNHKDGNKLNNNILNLEWVSRSENIKHSYSRECRGSNAVSVRCVTTGLNYKSIREASKYTGIGVGSIGHAVNGISKTAGGMIWEKI